MDVTFMKNGHTRNWFEKCRSKSVILSPWLFSFSVAETTHEMSAQWGNVRYSLTMKTEKLPWR